MIWYILAYLAVIGLFIWAWPWCNGKSGHGKSQWAGDDGDTLAPNDDAKPWTPPRGG